MSLPSSMAFVNLLDPFTEALSDARTTEVVVNRCGEFGVEADGKWSWHKNPLLTYTYLDAFGIVAAYNSAQDFDAAHPLCAATLPDGERVQLCRPPATAPGVISITIRKPAQRTRLLDDDDFEGMFDTTNQGKTQRARSDEALLDLYERKAWREFFRQAVKAKKTICVTGPTGSGKTDLLKRLIMEIPPETRVVTIEDTAEFGAAGPSNRVALFYGDARASLTAEDALKASLRCRPDRIIMQEVRGAEAFGFVRALAAGHPGGLTSYHADENREWDALELMVKQHEAGRALPDIRDYLKQYIDIVCWMSRGDDGFKTPRVWFKAAE